MRTNYNLTSLIILGMQFGLISDTHIPSRLKQIPSQIPAYFEGVDRILHCGDLSHPTVIHALEDIAPVIAIRGNNDWRMTDLPMAQTIEVQGLTLMMVHGHGGLKENILDRLKHLRYGLPFSYFYQKVLAWHPQADIILFGHIHDPHCALHGRTLLINPGSVAPIYFPIGSGPKAGKLTMEPDHIQVEIRDFQTQKTWGGTYRVDATSPGQKIWRQEEQT